MKPGVSIAMATYQGARYLSQQLESILQQTRRPDELVISDDLSKDETMEVANEFAKKAPFPVKLIYHRENPGANQNFENAILNCSHDIILMCDQDDFWMPNHIEKLVSVLESDSRINCVSSNSEFVDENLKPKGYTIAQAVRYSPARGRALMQFPRDQFELVLRHRVCAGHGMAFRNKLVPYLAPFSNNWLHDQWIYVLAAATGPVGFINEPLTIHRAHGDQATGATMHSLAESAARLRAPSFATQETKDEKGWNEVLERVKANPSYIQDLDYVEKRLEAKLNYVIQRNHFRRANLPARHLHSWRELLNGNHHRLGRGIVSFARDLVGSK